MPKLDFEVWLMHHSHPLRSSILDFLVICYMSADWRAVKLWFMCVDSSLRGAFQCSGSTT